VVALLHLCSPSWNNLKNSIRVKVNSKNNFLQLLDWKERFRLKRYFKAGRNPRLVHTYTSHLTRAKRRADSRAGDDTSNTQICTNGQMLMVALIYLNKILFYTYIGT
jgi:hypothetical protein